MKISEHTFKKRIIIKIACLIFFIPVIIIVTYFFKSDTPNSWNHFNNMSIRPGFEYMIQNGEFYQLVYKIKQEELELESKCYYNAQCLDQGAKVIKDKYSEFIKFGTNRYTLGSVSFDKYIIYVSLSIFIVTIVLIFKNYLRFSQNDYISDEWEPSDHQLYYTLILIPTIFSIPFLLNYVGDGSILAGDWGAVFQILLGVGLAVVYTVAQIIYFIFVNNKNFGIKKTVWVLFRIIGFVGLVYVGSVYIVPMFIYIIIDYHFYLLLIVPFYIGYKWYKRYYLESYQRLLSFLLKSYQKIFSFLFSSKNLVLLIIVIMLMVLSYFLH